jgi:hypothetical protein
MYIVPHSAVGVVIAKYFGKGKSLVVFVLAWVSHYVLDALPHTEVSTFLETSDELITVTREELLVFGFDLALAVIIVWILKKLKWWKSYYWWGVIGAMLPDILDNIPKVNVWLRQFHPFDWLHQLHQWAHIDMSVNLWMLGVILPIVVVALAIWYFYSSKKISAVSDNVNLVSKQEGRLKKGLKYLAKNETITNEQYRKLVGVSDRQAVRDFDELEKQGVIKQVGKTGKYTKYIKK